MLNTNDIKHLFLNELQSNNIKTTGYKCVNGTEYIELRNIIFEVDYPYIFENIPPYERMTDNWYIENYDPILLRNNQYEKCINKLIENSHTRQAMIIMTSPEEYDDPNGFFICTSYIHIFLDEQNDGSFYINYIVHMRSSDALEFRTDIQWNYKILDRIINDLKSKANYNIVKSIVIWNADTFHIYKEFFKQLTN